MSWSEWVDGSCRMVKAAGQWRRPRRFDAAGPAGTLDGGDDRVVSFASNDYLGLSAHPAVVAAAHDAVDRWGTGSGASRLVTGSRPVHHALEAALADYRGSEQAVVLPTGFAANLSVLSVFGAAGATIYSDERNHASIIDGCRLARAEVTVYPSGDLERLDDLLARGGGRPLVVSDTVFSMDGHTADVGGLAEVAARHRALLVVDEAHAVLGPDVPAAEVPVLRVGTLSKTLGALGGFVAGPRRYIELLVNRARPYIFSTAPTPADCAAALAALDIVRGPEGAALRRRLRSLVDRIAPGHPTPIIPVVLGDEAAAVAASAALLERGLWVPAIRPPTVPPGTSRLRVTLSAAHGDDQVDRLVAALSAVETLPVPEGPQVRPVTGAPAVHGAT